MDSEFLEYCDIASEEIKRLLKNRSCIVVYHSNDADGICSFFSFSCFLKKINCVSKAIGVEHIDEEVIKTLLRTNIKNVVFLDLGSGYLDLIKKISFEKNIIIIDHHKPNPKDEKIGAIHVNPELFGLPGDEFCSASTLTAYLFQDYLHYMFYDVPIVGALGDLQDIKKGKLEGLNREILKEAKKNNVIYSYTDLNIYYQEYDIITTLKLLEEPFLYELSDQKEIIKLLEELSINYKDDSKLVKWKDLSNEEKNKIINYLALLLLERGDIDEIFKLVKEHYFSLRLKDNCRKLSTVLNSMTKYGETTSALKFLCGALDKREVEKFLRIHKNNIKRSLEMANKVKKDIDGVTILDLRSYTPSGIIGAVAGLFQKSSGSNLVIAIALHNSGLKISVRASENFEKDVSSIIQKVSKKVGGYGGGHEKAGGAVIPKDKLQEFIKLFVEEVKQ